MKITIDRLAQRLESELRAPLNLGSGEAARRIDGVAAGLCVRPETAEQAAAIVRLCAEAEAAVIPRGGGTAMAFGNPPRRADVVIELGSLARVIEHDAANLTVTVECGITLEALRARLAAEKQRAALDPPFPERATVGGTIAANLNGPSRFGAGAVRDLVIGIKVILASGESIKGGGKVVKNVAGYDMCKLFVGSLGTLGIIAEATLRLAPNPEATATLVADGALERAEEFVQKVAASALLPAAVFLSGSRSRGSWQVAVRCEGFSAAVERQLRELQVIAGGTALAVHVLTPGGADSLWAECRDLPLAPNHVVYRLTVPRGSVFAVLRESRSWNPQDTVCDASVGTLWLGFPASRPAVRYLAAMESVAREHRGHAVLVAAPPELKAGINVWGSSPANLVLMQEIKRQFDPAALFNPGRFVGGL